MFKLLLSIRLNIFVKKGFCVAVNCGNNSFKKQKNIDVSFLFLFSKDEKLKTEMKTFINIRREELQK